MKRTIDAMATAFFNKNYFKLATQHIGMLAYGAPDINSKYLSPEAGDDVLGHALRLSISASKRVGIKEFENIWHSGVLEQKEEAEEAWEMEHYGYETKHAMYKNMRICTIAVFGDEIDIQPTRHKGLGSFSVTPDSGLAILKVPLTSTDEELGAALKLAFTRCTSSSR